MNTIQRLAKNVSLLFISSFITYGFAFIFNIYSARYLGVENFGILSFALSFSAIMIIFADLGLSPLMAREISRNKDSKKKYITNIGLIKLILAVFTFIISSIMVLIIGYNGQNFEVVALVILSSIFGSFSVMYYAFFQAHERMEYESIGKAFKSLLLLGGALFLIYYKMDILSFAMLYFIVGLILILYTIFIYRWKFALPKVEVNSSIWKSLLIASVPISIFMLLDNLTFRVDTVILSILSTNLAVGIYNAPYRIIEALVFIPMVFTSSIYPVFSRYYISAEESLKKGYVMSFKYLTFIGLPIATIIMLLADPIILLIYGNQYIGSIIALKILIWSIPLIFLAVFSASILISINKQNLLLKIISISLIINIVLNVIFIPSFSYIAASVSTVITELIQASLTSFFLFKFICKIQVKEIIVKPLIACLVTALFIIYVDLNLFVEIFAAIGVYILTLFVLKTFSDEDFDLIKQVFPIKKK